MKCQYPNCNSEASFKVGLADPDAEGSFYCSGHADERMRELRMKLFGAFSGRCIAMIGDRHCLNSKKFGDYCGIHAKLKIVRIEK